MGPSSNLRIKRRQNKIPRASRKPGLIGSMTCAAWRVRSKHRERATSVVGQLKQESNVRGMIRAVCRKRSCVKHWDSSDFCTTLEAISATTLQKTTRNDLLGSLIISALSGGIFFGFRTNSICYLPGNILRVYLLCGLALASNVALYRIECPRENHPETWSRDLQAYYRRERRLENVHHSPYVKPSTSHKSECAQIL